MNKIQKANELTCWKSLAYCCSLKKPCHNRDKALKILNLNKDGYIHLKQMFDENLGKLLFNREEK